MAFNQFLTVTRKDTTLHVEGKTKSGLVGGMEELTIAVGVIGDDGVLPRLGDDLLQRTLGLRQLESPWFADFEQAPPGYGHGQAVILVGIARGDLPDGPIEVWYERGKIA